MGEVVARIRRGNEVVQEFRAQSRDALGDILMLQLLANHAAEGHQEFTYDIDDTSSHEHVELVIECLSKRCGKQKYQRFETTVPRWLVATATLAFHTNHEGHPMRVTVDGFEIESPYAK